MKRTEKGQDKPSDFGDIARPFLIKGKRRRKKSF